MKDPSPSTAHSEHHLRFQARTKKLESAFGSDSFGARAEAFARFFGTSTFLIVQTVIVAGWVIFNITGLVHFDLYPFILLNLAFSLQAAYSAPLILLAQTRQADRDKAGAESEAIHREEIAKVTTGQLDILATLLQRNTELTKMTHQMSERIQTLTAEIRHQIRD